MKVLNLTCLPMLALLGLAVAQTRAQESGVIPIEAVPIEEHKPDNRNVKVFLRQSTEVFQPGDEVMLVVVLAHESGWHSYWQNPGDSGMPTNVVVMAPADIQVGEVMWPTPMRFESEGVFSYGYEGETQLLIPIKIPATFTASQLELEVTVNLLACKEVCIPENSTMKINFYQSDDRRERVKDYVERAKAQMPRDISQVQGLTVTSTYGDTDLQITVGAARPIKSMDFFALDPEIITAEPGQFRAEGAGGVLVLPMNTIMINKVPTLKGVLIVEYEDGQRQAVKVELRPGN
ncbi:MAG: protein-disulfide reductase DsbD domain-containing protein [Fimbriimonadaceae bacterium]